MDVEFGRQKLTGVNPNIIELCKDIPTQYVYSVTIYDTSCFLYEMSQFYLREMLPAL